MRMTASTFTTWNIIKIIHPLNGKRDNIPILDYRKISLSI